MKRPILSKGTRIAGVCLSDLSCSVHGIDADGSFVKLRCDTRFQRAFATACSKRVSQRSLKSILGII